MPKNAKKQVLSSQYIDPPSHFFGDHSISTCNAIVTSVTLSYTLTKYIQGVVVCMYVRVYVHTYASCILSDFPYVVTVSLLLCSGPHRACRVPQTTSGAPPSYNSHGNQRAEARSQSRST